MTLSNRFAAVLACMVALHVIVALARGADPFATGGPIAAALVVVTVGLPVFLIIDAVHRWRARGRRAGTGSKIQRSR